MTTLRPSAVPFLLTGTLVLALSACGSEADPGEDARNANFGLDGPGPVQEPEWVDGEPWTVDPAPLVTIGGFSAGEESQLVRVSGAVRLAEGELVVSDQGSRTVRLYDSAGRFIRLLGGPGSGPGEFRDPASIVKVGEGRIGVWDGQLFRITWFDASGKLETVDPVDLGMIAKAVTPPLYPASAQPLEDGRYLVRLIEKAIRKGQAAEVGSTSRSQSGVLAVSADLGTVDTVAFFKDAEEIMVDAPWGPQALPAPLARTTSVATHGDPATICVGEQEDPTIRCWLSDGEERMLRVGGHPAPPFAWELESWRAEMSAFWGRKVSDADHRRIMNAVPLPTVRAPYGEIQFDSEGFLWVDLGPSGADPDSPSIYEVFQPDRGFLGSIRVPPVQVLDIGPDYLLGLHWDRLDVESVRLFRLER